MRVPSTSAILLILILALATVGAGMAIAESDFDQQLDDDLDPDGLLIDIHLPGGDTAIWTIEHRYRLDTDDDSAAFESLQADIEDDPDPYVERFRDRIERTAEAAEAATGREMTIRDVSVETERRNIPQEHGIVRYSFQWDGFAVAADNRIHAGDAIAGMFFDDETTLRITWNEVYALESIDPEHTERGETVVLWRGPVDFTSDQPRIVLVGDVGFLGLGLPVLAGAGLVIILVLVVVAWRVGGNLTSRIRIPGTQSPPSGDLLTNEEQVLTMIEEGGGRIKQQEIVNQLGWTDAKTSKVVTQLREDGKIERLRIGRENVLSLPEEPDQDE